MNSWPSWIVNGRERLDGGGLLALRLWVGQEFAAAGWTKLSGGWHAPDWFAGLAFPLPVSLLPPDLNWLLAGGCELVFGLALLLGGWSRLAALVLMGITAVAIYSVHFDLGWAGWNQIETEQGQGFKLPLMLGLMLAVLLTQGAGRWSWDGWRAAQRRAATTGPR